MVDRGEVVVVVVVVVVVGKADRKDCYLKGSNNSFYTAKLFLYEKISGYQEKFGSRSFYFSVM